MWRGGALLYLLHDDARAPVHALVRQLLAAVEGNGRATLHFEEEAHVIEGCDQLELDDDGVFQVSDVCIVAGTEFRVRSLPSSVELAFSGGDVEGGGGGR